MTAPRPDTMPEQDAAERRCHHAGCRVPSALLYESADEDGVVCWTCNTHDANPEAQAARQLNRQRGQLTSQMRFSRRRKAHLVGPMDTLEAMEREGVRIIEAMGLGDLDKETGGTMLRGIAELRKIRETHLKETSLRTLQEQVDELRRERKEWERR